MSHTNNPRNTEAILRETFSERANHYYPDDTQAPALPIGQDASSRPSRLKLNQPKRGPLLLAAASAVVLALGSVFAMRALTTSGIKVDIGAGETPSATSSASPGPETDDSLAHMTPDHDGPVLVVGHPISCPDAAPDDTGLRIPTEPTNPIEFCKKLNLMGEVDPEKALVTTRVGWIFIEDRHPGASESAFESPEAERAALKKDELPAGHTFTGTDYEMNFARPLTTDQRTRQCRAFEDVMNEVNHVLKEVSRDSWVSKVTDSSSHGGPNAHNCTSLEVNMQTRTILVKKPLPGATQPPVQPQNPQWLAKLEKRQNIETAVNDQCLSADEAVKVANEAIRNSGLEGVADPAVVQSVPNGRECAKLYQYPTETLAYIVFGQ